MIVKLRSHRMPYTVKDAPKTQMQTDEPASQPQAKPSQRQKKRCPIHHPPTSITRRLVPTLPYPSHQPIGTIDSIPVLVVVVVGTIMTPTDDAIILAPDLEPDPPLSPPLSLRPPILPQTLAQSHLLRAPRPTLLLVTRDLHSLLSHLLDALDVVDALECLAQRIPIPAHDGVLETGLLVLLCQSRGLGDLAVRALRSGVRDALGQGRRGHVGGRGIHVGAGALEVEFLLGAGGLGGGEGAVGGMLAGAGRQGAGLVVVLVVLFFVGAVVPDGNVAG